MPQCIENISTEKDSPVSYDTFVFVKYGSSFSYKNKDSIICKIVQLYNTGSNVVCCYRGQSGSFIMGFIIALSEFIPDFLHSDFHLFGV